MNDTHGVEGKAGMVLTLTARSQSTTSGRASMIVEVQEALR